MVDLLRIITIISCILCLAYVIMLLAFCYGWVRTRSIKAISSGRISVAVIVAARNEEKGIKNCLEALTNQSYHSEKTEIIIVDDHSSDHTAAIIHDHCRVHANCRSLKPEKEGKKNAITTAIKNTNADLIITTDADCTMGPEWIEKIVSFYEHAGAGMIVGPVAFTNEQTVFEKMQSLELMALIASTCGSLYYKKPVMCNGANLAYPRQLFNEVNGFEGIDHIASGDDVLLMYKIGKLNKAEIRFLKDREAVVFTSAKPNLAEFIEQRNRWASKAFDILNTETKVVSLIIYLFSFFILLMSVLSGFASIKSSIYLPFLQICLILVGIKCVIDFLLLFLATSFFEKKRYLYLFLPEQFIYVLYVVLVGLPRKKRYDWKGRKI
jgi:cellulose synthase/poly-beta-1,6-N-acetylglucosamine synthase-like glycosyltransferase